MSGSAVFLGGISYPPGTYFGRTFGHYRRTLSDVYFLGTGLIVGTAGNIGNHRISFVLNILSHITT